jgi:hypothetical protein
MTTNSKWVARNSARHLPAARSCSALYHGVVGNGMIADEAAFDASVDNSYFVALSDKES